MWRRADGIDLNAYLGQQVTLQGSVRTLPGGDMPYMSCEKVIGGNSEPASSPVAREAAPISHIAAAERSPELPMREVVLQPQADQDANDQYVPKRKPARRVETQRARQSGVRPTYYQETVPAPAPTTSGRGPRTIAEPTADPGPAMERRPDDLRRPGSGTV